jgi:Na+-driven multidrug efflux pump
LSETGPKVRLPRPANPLLDRPILPTLLALAAPNVVALTLQSLVVIAETGYIGRLGTESLAAMALVFPMIMLTQMMSSGAMGGGVSSAIARALGSGDQARARALAVHAIAIGAAAGVALSGLVLVLGPGLYELLGGSGPVLELAIAYSTTFFAGSLAVWLLNTLVSVVRGTGNMRLPSVTLIGVGAGQIVLGGALALGLGPLPRMGLPGVALGQIASFAAGACFLALHLRRGRARLRVSFAGVRAEPELFLDILKVGAVACLSPIQSILVVLILARLAAGYSTAELAGFGIGIRLELLLVPIAFAIGVACVPMVGMAIGAGDVGRARRVAWTGASLAGVLIGSVGVLFAVRPALWGGLFTEQPAVLGALAAYLGAAGWAFPAYGFGLCLYFAAQGSGRILGPVLGGTVRLAVVLAGGALLLAPGAPFATLAHLVAAAMLAYGVATALFVWLTRWGKA